MVRNRKELDTFDSMLYGAVAIKVLSLIIASVTLSLCADYSDDYTVAIIIVSGSLTLLYAVVSILVEIGMLCKCAEARKFCYMVDALASCFCLCFWLLSSGTAITISLRSGAKTTELFAWISACCCVEILLFCIVSGLYCFQFINNYVVR